MSDSQVIARLRATSGVTDPTVLKEALDMAARGLGSRLPCDLVRALGAELPVTLAEPLMAGAGDSPASPAELSAWVARAANLTGEASAWVIETVLALVAEAGRPETVRRVREVLAGPWADLLCPRPEARAAE